jgi:hypothetical protein
MSPIVNGAAENAFATKLKITVSGNISDPSFQRAKAISQVLIKRVFRCL